MKQATGHTLNEAIADGRLVDEYLNELAYRRRSSPRTVESYKSDLNLFLCFLSAGRGKGVLKCKRDDVLAFIVACSESGEVARTRARRLSTIKGFYSFLKRRGRIDETPTAGLKGAKIPDVLPEVLSSEDMEVLLEAGRTGTKTQRRVGMIIELMYATGLRVSEAVGLRLEHIVFKENIILVESGKGGKDRVVILPEITSRRLREYIDEVRPLILGGGYSSWVFPTRTGRSIDRQTAWRDMKAIAREAGLKVDLHPHLLRHTCATHLIENGCDLLTVQALLGHSDISTTEIYTHILEDRKRKVFNAAHPRARF